MDATKKLLEAKNKEELKRGGQMDIDFPPENVPLTSVAALAPDEVTAPSARFARGSAPVGVQISMDAIR
jgi:hypothetical protein